MRKLIVLIGWCVVAGFLVTVGWFCAGWYGTVAAVGTVLLFTATFVLLLFQQAVSARSRGAHADRPAKEEDVTAPDLPAPARAPASTPARAAGQTPALVQVRAAEQAPALVRIPAPGQTPGQEPGQVPAPGEAPVRSGGSERFPRPAGRPGPASRRPWRLPAHPGPAGISADSVLVGDLHVRAASIVGPGHRCEEPATPRQDAYRLGIDQEDRHLIVVVADGMSDSSHSDLGANVAADTITRHLRIVLAENAVDEKVMRECFGSAAERMTATARQRGLFPDDVRTAVLAVIVELRPDAHGRRKALFGVVADVSAWVRRERSWRQIAGDAKQGLDAGRLSEFLPHTPSAVKVSTRWLDPGDVLALTTDGIGDALAASGELATWFVDKWERPPFIGEFIDTVGFEAKGYLDDRTAIVVWCPGERP